MMRWIFWGLVLIVIGVPLAAIGLLAASFEDNPALVRTVEVSPEHIERAKRLLAAHDPRKMPAGVLRTFSVSGPDLDLALNTLLFHQGGAAQLALSPGVIMLWVTVKAPANPFGAYWNIEAVVRQTSGLPQFDRLRVGRVSVPGFVADWVLERMLLRLNETETEGVAADILQSVRVDGDFLQIEYRWRADLPDRLRSVLLPAGDQASLRAYQERLAELTADGSLPRQLSLASLLQPMFAAAGTRSIKGDPVAENRAALIVLAFYLNGHGLHALVPEARQWPRAQPRRVTLAGRSDFVLHFIISAAVAATAGTPLADAIGVYKEIEDKRRGSGFSFADIAADRAGTLFGQHAVQSAASARALQDRLAEGIIEADFMPLAGDLPEGLSEAEFKRRFGGLDAPAYRELMQQIEKRLAGLALYR
jgi:hypothetical protein